MSRVWKQTGEVYVVFSRLVEVDRSVAPDGETCGCCRSTKHLNIFDGRNTLRPPCPVCERQQWNASTGEGLLAQVLQQPKSLPHPAFSLNIFILGVGILEQFPVDDDCEICRETGTVPLWLNRNGENDPSVEIFACPLCRPLKFEIQSCNWSDGLAVEP